MELVYFDHFSQWLIVWELKYKFCDEKVITVYFKFLFLFTIIDLIITEFDFTILLIFYHILVSLHFCPN